MENISVFKQNGFEIIIEDNDMPVGGVDDTKILPAHADERAELGMAVYNDEEGYEVSTELEGQSGSRRRVKLVAQPISGNTVFDVKDFEELLHKMRDLPTGTMVRCSKARAMFASRACRKSIMVGMALENKQMTSVVRHMGTMEQPWNCPHGRPTMRHLTDLKAMKKTKKDRQIDWTGFGMV